MTIQGCSLCPRLCRPACPVTVGTAREIATPTLLAAAALLGQRKQWPESRVAHVVTMCTDCGACMEHCHLHAPLPEALRQTRRQVVPEPPMEPLEAIEGEGRRIAIESDEREFAKVLSGRLGEPVRRWRTRDALGVAAIEHPGFEARARAIRAAVGDGDAVVIHGGVAQALTASQISFRWLHELVAEAPEGLGSCQVGGKKYPR